MNARSASTAATGMRLTTREDSEAVSRATPWFSPRKYRVTPVKPPATSTGRSARATPSRSPPRRATTGSTATAMAKRYTAMVMGGISTTATLMLRKEIPHRMDRVMPRSTPRRVLFMVSVYPDPFPDASRGPILAA